MSNAALGVPVLAAALGFVGIIIWQWRSDDFVDPIFHAFASQPARRPLMWFTTVFYGFMAALSMFAAFQLLKGGWNVRFPPESAVLNGITI